MHSTPRRIHAQSALATLKSAMVALLLLTAFAAQAQLNIPGNNGQDGAFAPNANIQVDLSQAVTGQWDTTNSTGQGVYDPEQWAVIFRFTEVTIPSNVTVTFKNHPSRAPVIWLVQGNVTIAGTVNLNGANGHGSSEATPATLAEPGPGGFRGGRGVRTGSIGSAGMGPGGGGYPKVGASYHSVGAAFSGSIAGKTYGNVGIFPLIGGSGGSGSDVYRDGGGGGGGAILIAVNGSLTLNGIIVANGGSSTATGDSTGRAGGGSGGSIRFVADAVHGSGALHVVGGTSTLWVGSKGRTRIEANSITLSGTQVDSTGLPQNPPRIFREPGDGAPSITAMTLNGQAVPDDPASYPTQDVALLGVDEADTVPLVVTAEHVPAGSTVKARVVRISGVEDVITAVFNGEVGDVSTWTADIPVAGGFSTIQVHAVLP